MAQQLQAQKAAADLAKTVATTAKKKKVTPLNIGRKKGSKVIVNIGSNIDAILPRREDGPCAMSIAVEPMVPHKIKPHPALKVVGAAVTGEDIDGSSSSLAIMYEYNTDAQSSSLSQVSKEEPWNKGYGQMHLVPAISLRNLLDLLSDYEIEFLKTDMQGHDFSAIKSVRLADYGIKRVYNEVYWNDMSSYKGIKNDMCLDWWPEMKRQGTFSRVCPTVEVLATKKSWTNIVRPEHTARHATTHQGWMNQMQHGDFHLSRHFQPPDITQCTATTTLTSIQRQSTLLVCESNPLYFKSQCMSEKSEVEIIINGRPDGTASSHTDANLSSPRSLLFLVQEETYQACKIPKIYGWKKGISQDSYQPFLRATWWHMSPIYVLVGGWMGPAAQLVLSKPPIVIVLLFSFRDVSHQSAQA